MKLYVYALTDAAVTVSDLCGVRGETLAAIALLDGCAIVGQVDAAPAPTREALDVQDRLVRALHDRASALLPARFATLVEDERTLREHPLLQPTALTPALAQARGREQMTLRVVTNRPLMRPNEPMREIAPDGSGRRYLEQRASAVALPGEVREIVTAVASLVRAERCEPGRVPGMLATLYHLIDRGRADDYRAAMGVRVSLQPSVSIAITGPAPAYAFGPADGM